ncbi:hypothetical protein ACWEAO_12005 [Micrococcus luteus]
MAPLYEFLGGITQSLTRWPSLRAQARRTSRELHHLQGHDRALTGARLLKMDLCGCDPVSEDAAAAFTERAQLLIDHYFEYVSDLYALAEKLGGSAKAYGYSEDEIEQSFRAPS